MAAERFIRMAEGAKLKTHVPPVKRMFKKKKRGPEMKSAAKPVATLKTRAASSTGVTQENGLQEANGKKSKRKSAPVESSSRRPSTRSRTSIKNDPSDTRAGGVSSSSRESTVKYQARAGGVSSSSRESTVKYQAPTQ